LETVFLPTSLMPFNPSLRGHIISPNHIYLCDEYHLTPLLLALRLLVIVLPPSFCATLSRPTASASHKDGFARHHAFSLESRHHLFGSQVCASTHLTRKSAGNQVGFIL
jgi:hypothetical protein